MCVSRLFFFLGTERKHKMYFSRSDGENEGMQISMRNLTDM